ncbi:DUF397 domain-containing protein [Streptomyces sp. UNOB3_S3]|uniref:DUF397 domain-containing protein n=1 Tax=Streptomyces sp. UNOB3_S3 TaxID=2871682 RepID=UPI0027E3872E|nr:DUF397 domain-containing protein [Streptomyces sp. UNOB3_S3]MCC3776722.1 DUF397 domain-containing protein [Streptomyces sp. UNOB3_S3]
MPVPETSGAGLARWRKPSRSGLENDCVEVADGLPGVVPVRDSKSPHGPVLVLEIGAWSAFVAGLRDGGIGAAGRGAPNRPGGPGRTPEPYGWTSS